MAYYLVPNAYCGPIPGALDPVMASAGTALTLLSGADLITLGLDDLDLGRDGAVYEVDTVRAVDILTGRGWRQIYPDPAVVMV